MQPNRVITGAAAALVLTASTVVVAHQDDPKERDRVPRYEGPGYRAGTAGPGGAAGLGFPVDGVNLRAWLPLGEFGSFSAANDCWGYTAPSGREYAIIGLSSGTGYVEITDPDNPVVVHVESAISSSWRDIKTYQDHAYVVTEGTGGGIQVMDLSAIDAGVVDLVTTITTGGTTKTHNVAIDTDSGFLYRCGGDSNGLRIYDLSSPSNPVFVGSWSTRYVHDCQVVTFSSGPYAGRQIAFACSGFNGGSVETGLDVLDVTNKSNIIQMGRLVYPNGAYSHQAWLSEDRQYIYLNDELDENGVLPTTTFVIDVSDLSDPTLATTFTNGNTAIGHNLYVKGERLYAANYRSGLRVFDVANPTAPGEIAYFDTWIPDDNDNFNGLWSVYPYFDSGIVIGSDIEKGLFVWDVPEPLVAIELTQPAPELIDPNGQTVQVAITELEPDAFVAGRLHYDVGAGFVPLTLQPLGGDLYEATLPTFPCGTQVAYYASAEGANGYSATVPAGAPANAFVAAAATSVDLAFADDMETDPGWTVADEAVDDGSWERGVPAGAGDRGDPVADYDGSGQCWLTDNVAGNSDVDGGPTRLTSPAIDLSLIDDPYISYARWFTNNDGDEDRLDVEISANGGGSWALVESVAGGGGWNTHTFRVTDFVTPSANVRLRFSATDNPNDSVTEAALDDLRVIGYVCDDPGVPGDVNGDGAVDFTDVLAVLTAWGPCAACPEDTDGNGVVGFTDLLFVLTNWS